MRMSSERSNTLTKCIQFSVDVVRLSEQQKAKQCSESLGKETCKLGVGKCGAHSIFAWVRTKEDGLSKDTQTYSNNVMGNKEMEGKERRKLATFVSTSLAPDTLA